MRPQSVGKGYKPQNTQKTQKGLNQEFFSACSAYSAVLQHFDQISEAPDAIPRLRRFILDLAVRGKLVEQDPNDEPAAELLKRIEKEKRHLEKASQSRKDKYFLPIKEDEIPFSVPASWIWVRLGDITIYIQRGKSPQYATGYGPLVISQKCIQWDGLHMEWAKSLVPESLKNYEPVRFLQDGDLLWNSTGTGTIGRVIRVDQPPEPQVCDSHVTVIRCLHVYELFVLIWLRSDYVYGTIEGRAIGATKQVELTASMANSQITPLPPFAEQHRIVAKVDELMALCDNLEAAQQKRERRRDRLVTASLAKLTDEVENKSILKFSVSSACSAISRPEHIHQLRQTILNLAVRGKLVPQNPKEESASDLLKRIQAFKEQMIREGKIKKEKPLPLISKLSGPFRIPSSWTWTRIGICSLITEYGTSVKSAHLNDGVPVLNMGDIQAGQAILKDQKRVPILIDDLPRLFLKHHDILYNRTNSAELVGKTGIFMGEDDTYTFASYLIRIRFITHLTSPIYINMAMNAPYFRESQIIPELKQQCGQANVNGTKLKNMMIPLPPIAEQYRIMAKVDELMVLCEELEARTNTSVVIGLQLLEAALHEALFGR